MNLCEACKTTYTVSTLGDISTRCAVCGKIMQVSDKPDIEKLRELVEKAKERAEYWGNYWRGVMEGSTARADGRKAVLTAVLKALDGDYEELEGLGK